jgi:HSP20 family protein
MNRLLGEMSEVFRNPEVSFNPQAPKAQVSLTAGDFPPVNMWSNEQQVIATVEVPGVNPDDIHLNVLEDTLSIQGKRVAEVAGEKQAAYHRQERYTGNFKRMFKLPFKIDPEKTEARYEKGVLRIVLTRSEKDMPKPIKVVVS